MKIKLKDIKPNPFRNMPHYPIQPEKIATLRESIRATGFWDNTLIARKHNGSVQLACGHHRWKAAIKQLGGETVVDVHVRDLTDEMMIKIMARENMQEWETDATVERETVRAVVEAFGAGRIQLRKASSQGGNDFRVAPSCVRQRRQTPLPEKAFNANTVAEFLGWLGEDGEPTGRVYTALNSLELIESAALKEVDLAGMSTTEAAATVVEVRVPMQSGNLEKARKVGQAIAKQFRADKQDDKKNVGRARERAERVARKVAREPKSVSINRFIHDLNKRLLKILSPDDLLTKEILAVLKDIDAANDRARSDLHTNLNALANRAYELAKLVKSGKGISKSEVKLLLMRA